MKLVPQALAACLLLFLTGCVTNIREVPLTGDIHVDAPRAITEGPPRDKVLWQYRLAAADMRSGNYAEAKQMLDEALLTIGGIFGKDKNARKSRSYFGEESKKTFIGEPYERVMAYYYRGILYWMDGEPDNARACFRSGEIEDSSTAQGDFNADYVLLDYLDGLATVKLDGDGSDAYKRSLKSMRNGTPPPPYDKSANVLVFVEFGPGPIKAMSGEYGEELKFNTPESPSHSATLKVDNLVAKAFPYDDLGFQAITRGGRVMDHVLANKAVFKSATETAGNVALQTGAIAALASRDRTTQEVGLGLMAAGILSKIISSATTPQADTRMWDNLPHYLSFASLHLAPGTHTVTVEFQGRSGEALPNFTKNLTINIPAAGHDKVVFVSDASVTPQTL